MKFIMLKTVGSHAIWSGLGPVAQSAGSLIADPGVLSFTPIQPFAFMEIDCEIFSMVIYK